MKLFRVSQKAFVRNDVGQLLLVRFAPDLHDPQLRGLWDIPGGGVEFGESLAAAKPISGKTYKSMDEHDYHGIILGFDARYIGGEIKLNEEHDGYKWIDPHRWQEFNTGFELQKIERIWRDYLRWYETYVSKAD